MKKRFALVAAIASMVLVGAACSNSGTGSSETTTPAQSPASSAGGGSTSTTLTMQNIAFSPTSLSVATGSTVDLDNEDSVTHTFTIDGQDVDVTVDGGTTGSAPIDLAAGSYDFHCKIHPSMTGTLTVTG
jgi:plastocyanin